MIHFAISFALAAAVPEIAHIDGATLVLSTRAGSVVRKIRMRAPIESFSIAPDLSTIAFIGKGGNQFGGPLYLYNIKTGRTSQPRGAPFWPPGPNDEPVDEVYADPAFSPDGKSLAFAIHSPPKNVPGDVVLAAGPLALLSMLSGRVSLASGGIAYTNSPAWSPDGASLFVNFENGFAVLKSDGTEVKQFERPGDGFSNALAWIGTECVAFGYGDNGKFLGAGVFSTRTGRFDHQPPEPYRFLFELAPFDSLQVTGDLALVGFESETRLFEVSSRKLLRRFPRGAKFIQPHTPLIKTPPAAKAAPSAPCHPTSTPRQN